MKQQQQNDTGLYRQLRSAFDMTPEQMQRVREEIQQRAAGQDSALPVTGQSRFTGIRRITLRTALSAACLLLIAGGGIRLYQGLADNPLTQQSSVLVEEQLTCPTESGTGIAATSAPETTTAPETSRTTSSGQQTTTSGTTVTTTSQTAAETTQSADTTEATTTEETVTTTESAEQTTTTQPTTTTVTTTTAVTTTTTAEPENTFEIVETPEQANIMIPDLTCAAGETVTVNVVLTEDMDVAGFQCDLLLNCPADAPAPTLLRRSTEIVQITGGQVIWNTPFPSVNPEVILVFGGENSTHLPAGIKLLSITYQIPEDAASGTVYRFSNDSLLLFAAKEPDFAIAARMYPGSITVG